MSWAQFTPSADRIQFPIVAIGDVPVSTDYDEDVATSIVITGVVDTIGMSASVKRSKEPRVASSSPVTTSFVGVIGDGSDNRGYI